MKRRALVPKVEHKLRRNRGVVEVFKVSKGC